MQTAIITFLRYEDLLRRRPLLTKSATSAVLSTAGCIVSSAIRHAPLLSADTFAHAVYGLLVAGPVPHAFYSFLERFPGQSFSAVLLKILLERTILAPVMVGAYFMVTNLAKGVSFDKAFATTRRLFQSTLFKNWIFWTPAIIVNMKFIHPRWRVVFASLVAFLWTIYLAAANAAEQRRNSRK